MGIERRRTSPTLTKRAPAREREEKVCGIKKSAAEKRRMDAVV